MTRMNKKKTAIIAAVIVAIAVIGAVAIGMSASSHDVQGEEEFHASGEGMKAAVENLLKADKRQAKNYFAEVAGEKISKEYFAVRYASYSTHPLNYENPKGEAWNSIKLEFWEKQFAESHGLTPTAAEIESLIDYNKKEFDSNSDFKTLITEYAGGMGFSVKEYWKYNREYLAPVAVTHGKVAEYLEANNMNAPAPDEIDGKILDEEYFDSLP